MTQIHISINRSASDTSHFELLCGHIKKSFEAKNLQYMLTQIFGEVVIGRREPVCSNVVSLELFQEAIGQLFEVIVATNYKLEDEV